MRFLLSIFLGLPHFELVSPSRAWEGGLRYVDVRCDGSVLYCYLGRGTVVSLHGLAGSAMCPVQVFGTYSSVRPVVPSPLLVHADGSFLSKFQFIQVFHQCLVRLGLESRDFSSHSFHIGSG